MSVIRPVKIHEEIRKYKYQTLFKAEFKGPHSRRRTRALLRILPAYTIIILDHNVVEFKFQRSK